jgi:hypothetical protein
LMGAIVSFYFGARHQAKGQDFQRSIAASVARAPQVLENTAALEALTAGAQIVDDEPARPRTGPNPALEAWRAAS